jgi:hypothetical protein
LGLSGPRTGKTEEGATVEIVSIEVAEPEPGVTLGGEKEHDEREGSPEQVSETGFVNAPNMEPTVIV